MKAEQIYKRKMKMMKDIERQGMRDWRKRVKEVRNGGTGNERRSVDVMKTLTEADVNEDEEEEEESPDETQSKQQFHTIGFFDQAELYHQIDEKLEDFE